MFGNCQSLKTIYVKDSWDQSLSCTDVPVSARIVILHENTVFSSPLWESKKVKDVVIPDGTALIDSHLFWRSEIESVVVPASVRSMGVDVFCECSRLRRVAFEGGTQLQKLSAGCFKGTGIEEIEIPSSVVMIG